MQRYITLRTSVALAAIILIYGARRSIKRNMVIFNTLRQIIVLFVRRSLFGPLVSSWSFAIELMIMVQKEGDDKKAQEQRYLMDVKDVDFVGTRVAIKEMVEDGTVPGGPADLLRRRLDISGTTAEWMVYQSDVNLLNAQALPEEGNCKVIIYLHGGGYCILSVDTHVELISRILVTSGRTTTKALAIDYKLAPEHPFPHALNEVVKVYQYALEVERIKPENIVLAGDSAGGGLAIASCLKLRELRLPLPAGIACMSPWVDLECKDPSYFRNAETDYINLTKCKLTAMCYTGGDVSNPLCSPINADLRGLPPILLQAGDREIFIDSIIAFAEKAKREKVKVSLEVYDDMYHVHQAFYNLNVTKAQAAISSFGHFIKSVCGCTVSISRDGPPLSPLIEGNITLNMGDKADSVLVYGSTGWVGSMLVAELRSRGLSVISASSRLEDRPSLLKEIQHHKPQYVVNAAGIVGKPNVDWCEDHKEDVIRTNVVGALNILDVCNVVGVHLTVITTGCIYHYDDDHTVGGELFTEESEPNFTDSFYSLTKGIIDPLYKLYKSALVLRIRMPITADLRDPRNLITKLVNFEKIISIPNSMSVLPDLIPVAAVMMRRKIVGVFNFTNPGATTHSEILDMYIKHVNPSKTYSIFTLDEHDKVVVARRSNNQLDTSKLVKAVPDMHIPNIRDSIEAILSKVSEST